MATYAPSIGQFTDRRIGSREMVDRLYLGLILFVCCFQTVVRIEPAPFDIAIMGLLGLGFLLGRLSFARVNILPFVFLAGFAVMNIISMKDAYEPTRALFYMGVTLYLILSWVFYVGLVGHYGDGALAILMKGYVISGVFSGLLGILACFHMVPYFDELTEYGGRARALFKDCNVFGPYFIPMALYAAVGLLRGGKTLKGWLFHIALFLLSATAILMSFSRAAWIAFGIALVTFFLMDLFIAGDMRAAMRKLGAFGATCVLAGALVFALLQVPVVGDMMGRRIGKQGGLQRYDTVERAGVHEMALRSAVDHPLGIGPGQSELVFRMATHSAYLRVLSENGLAALVFFGGFLVLSLGKSVRMAMTTTDPAARDIFMIVAACITGHFINSYVIDTVHWRNIWFICAIPWCSIGRSMGSGSAGRRTA